MPQSKKIQLALIAAALLPLGIVHGHNLWQRPHYQFFPLVLVGVWLIVGKIVKEASYEETSSQTLDRIQWALFATILLATLIFSPSLVPVALVCVTILLVLARKGPSALKAALAPTLVLILLIPLPSGLETRVLGAMQTWSAGLASPLLDVWDVRHVMEGNIIKLASRSLLVEEACSGMSSLLSVTISVLLLGMWLGWGALACAASVAVGAVWALLGNVLRITLVAVAADKFNLELAVGWRHELLGVFIYALVTLLTMSNSTLIQAIATSLNAKPLLDKSKAPEKVESLAPISIPESRWWDRLSFPVWMRAGLTLALLLQLIVVGRAYFFTPKPRFVASIPSQVASFKIPERFAGVAAFNPTLIRRGEGNSNGEFSQAWRMMTSRGSGLASFDYPFIGWHELSICYTARGWRVSDRNEFPEDKIVTLQLERNQFEHGFVLFSVMELDGKLILPERPSLGSLLLNRLQRVALLEPPILHTRTVQFQILLTSTSPLTNIEKSSLVQLYAETRKKILENTGVELE